MKVLVTGASGQLGTDMMAELALHGVEALGCGRDEMDITNPESVRTTVDAFQPDVIIHCASYTDVDSAETEVRLCSDVNAQGTVNVANAAKRVNAKLVYISTDYVFGGEGKEPIETDHPYNPLNVYGLTKMQGEKYITATMRKYFIVRTSWLFGTHGDNFVKKMLEAGNEHVRINVVSDQIGSPTFTEDLARLIYEMISTDRYGIYHATNEGFCSRADFAKEIMQMAGLPCRIEPVLTSEYETAAKRPMNSRLSKDSLDMAGFSRMPTWMNGLAKYLLEVNEYGI